MDGKLSFVSTPSGGLRPEGDIATASRRALLQGKADLTRWLAAASDKAAAGKLSDVDRANLDAVRQHAAVVSSTLAEREADNEREREQARQLAGGTLDADAIASQRAGAAIGLPGAPRPTSAAGGFIGAKWRELFPRAGAAMDGWRDSGEFVRCVGLGLNDQRLRAESMTGNVGSAGGFLVPPGVLGPMWDAGLEQSIVMPRCTTWPITVGRERQVPTWDIQDRSSGDVAGLEIDWQPEAPASDADVQIARLRLITLRARRGAIFAEASTELEQDGQDYSAQLSGIMSRAIAYGLDRTFLYTGTGAEAPLSVFNSGALVTVARNTANQVIYEDVLSMFSRLAPGSIARAIWIAHSSTLPQLAKLSFAIGTGGAAAPVLTNTAGEFRILGLPVVFTEKAQVLGTLGDLSLMDLSAYFVGVRQDATLDRSIHPGFRRAVVTYRMMFRIDGMPAVNAPTSPPNSGATQSPFVALGDPA